MKAPGTLMTSSFQSFIQTNVFRWLSYLLAALVGVLAYQFKPWVSYAWLPEPMTVSQVQQAQSFAEKYPNAVVVMDAFLNLRSLVQQEKQTKLQYAAWDDQQRDEGWAEATEYLLARLAVTSTQNQLRIVQSECRNTLCQVRLLAPVPLNSEFTARILDYAKVLKAADLEYLEMQTEGGVVLLMFKANKDYKFSGALADKFNPAIRQQWEQEVLAWYKK